MDLTQINQGPMRLLETEGIEKKKLYYFDNKLQVDKHSCSSVSSTDLYEFPWTSVFLLSIYFILITPYSFNES
jgi:hypothetical protein